MRKSKEFFVCQQGFAAASSNPHLYSALMLQPRLIGGFVVLGSILQSPGIFLALATVLAWGTLVPAQNLFDAIYNLAIAWPRGYPPLPAAPAPRRFAQGTGALVALATGVALLTGETTAAWVLEGIFVVAGASAVVRRFCLPAHMYYVLARRVAAEESCATL